MKRSLSLVLSLALSLSLLAPAFALEASPFSDVPVDHWAVEAIWQASQDGIIQGMGDGRFAPNNELTAAQFAAIVIRAFYWRELKDLGENTPRDTWYARYQKVAEDAGLMKDTGVEDWTAPMTRYQMAQMLYNIAVDQKFVLPGEDALKAVRDKIGDWSKVPKGYQTAVSAAYAMDLLSGVDAKGTFAGDQSLSRAQAAVIYSRLEEALAGIQGIVERTLEREERQLASTGPAYTFALPYSFDRYPGPGGTAYVARQSGTPHGGIVNMAYVYEDGRVLDISALLPSYFMYGTNYLSPSGVEFSGDGAKLFFVTPVREGTGAYTDHPYEKDWGPTLCTVDLVSGTMESMVPVQQ